MGVVYCLLKKMLPTKSYNRFLNYSKKLHFPLCFWTMVKIDIHRNIKILYNNIYLFLTFTNDLYNIFRPLVNKLVHIFSFSLFPCPFFMVVLPMIKLASSRLFLAKPRLIRHFIYIHCPNISKPHLSGSKGISKGYL